MRIFLFKKIKQDLFIKKNWQRGKFPCDQIFAAIIMTFSFEKTPLET
jgi:hypothetical protein